MPAKFLHCPNCGDLWKRIRFERFIRLGARWRQCRACNAWHDSEHAEWATLRWTQRIVFLGQNLVYVLPPALLFLSSALISQFMGMVPEQDLIQYSLVAGVALLGFLSLLLVRSVWHIVLSLARTRRGAQRSLAVKHQENKFISEAAWQASAAARPRLSPPLVAPGSKVEAEQKVSGDGLLLPPAKGPGRTVGDEVFASAATAGSIQLKLRHG